jgi:hypothetical protein
MEEGSDLRSPRKHQSGPGALRFVDNPACRHSGLERLSELTQVYRRELYVAPGHLPILEAGIEYIELSPAEAFAKTMEVVGRNMAATAQT